MSGSETIKKYSNGELIVVWKPKLCIHAKNCVKMLPEVYNPEERPWIKAENGTTEALKEQIAKCPSGALSYELNEVANVEETATTEIKVEVAENGPLLIHGNFEVIHKTGTSEKKTRTTAFCRCGASKNKPYCDGTHNAIAFKG